MKKKIMVALSAACLMTTIVTGCSQAADKVNHTEDNAQVASQSTTDETKELTGTITLAGSTSMEKLCEALIESFKEEYPNIVVTAEYVGSGAGLESLAAGKVDIGNASRHLKDEEIENGLVENVVSVDGMAIILDADNPVNDISSDELAKLFTGEITNWSVLGGKDEAVIVVGANAGGGTRVSFEEKLDIKDKCQYISELDSAGAILTKVARTPGAIGYVSTVVADKSVKAVAINGILPSEESVKNGSFMFSTPYVMATKGETLNEALQKWFSFIYSDKGKEVIESVGLIATE